MNMDVPRFRLKLELQSPSDSQYVVFFQKQLTSNVHLRYGWKRGFSWSQRDSDWVTADKARYLLMSTNDTTPRSWGGS
jgi:hypothetical protein